jgi:hypothetical protein
VQLPTTTEGLVALKAAADALLADLFAGVSAA